MKKYHIVYLTINKINGKCYVGSHSTNDLNDNYYGSGTAIKESLKKYKKDNFHKIILKHLNNHIEARNLEKYYINLYDTLTPNGYNISPTGGLTLGIGSHSDFSKEKIGKSNKGKKLSKETKEKMRLSKLNISDETKRKIGEASRNRSPEANYRCGSTNRGKETWMKGKKHTEESKQKNREKHLGKKHTEESKIKISNASKGKNNPMYGKTFYSIWLEKYGKNIADKKYKQWKERLKKSNKRKNK
jgi:group I intron endonuclease